mmetsp:Transcript_18555/g.31096  ORF Transcript_18555/g.31096 Transcript_18555/m.31096 type:complete len:233 (-) Transcript_18555:210-908(-)
MFVPSPRLLTRWHLQYNMLAERTWAGALLSQTQTLAEQQAAGALFGQRPEGSLLPRHANYSFTPQPSSSSGSSVGQQQQFDPNDDSSEQAILAWISLADFYQWPHIQQFDSWQELFRMLVAAGVGHAPTTLSSFSSSDKSSRSLSLQQISEQMGAFNRQEDTRIRAEWSRILTNIRRHKEKRQREQVEETDAKVKQQPPPRLAAAKNDINPILHELYGFQLSNTDCNAQIYD